MPFQISDAIAKALAGWNIDKLEAIHEANRIADQFPDLAAQEQAFVAWAQSKLDPALDPAKLVGTLTGIYRDIRETGFVADQQAFTGNV